MKENLNFKDKKKLINFLLLQFKQNKRLVISLKGNSMKPTILPNQKVEIILFPYEELKHGDIIAYRYHQKHITIHRVKEIIYSENEMFLITKGDHNDFVDSYLVNKSIYLGKVVV